jgi:hypothetical protein
MSQQKTYKASGRYDVRVSLGDSLNSELKNQLENFKSKLKPVSTVSVVLNSTLKNGDVAHKFLDGFKPTHIICPGCGLNIKT